jgi:hypothetical protein
MAEEKQLPGWPSKTLVRKVKSVLWRYVRCRPQIADPLWQTTWLWADACRRRNELFDFSKRRRAKWPADYEIATQYLILAITEMRSCCQLRLPFHAGTHMPDKVKQILQNPILLQLSGSQVPVLPGPSPST